MFLWLRCRPEGKQWLKSSIETSKGGQAGWQKRTQDAEAALQQARQERDNVLANDRKREELWQGVIEKRNEALRELRQARQEIDRLRPMAERYLDIKEGR